MTLETNRLILKTSDTEMTDQVFKYYYDNRDFFAKYEPSRDEEYYTFDYQYALLRQEAGNMERLTGAYYYYYLKVDPEHIIGSISFSRLRKDPYFSTIFGYNIDYRFQGQGYCTEACRGAMEHVMEIAPIHRIDARVLTDNAKSIRVLDRLGFEKEGFEKASILIGGEFRDHLRYAYLNEGFEV